MKEKRNQDAAAAAPLIANGLMDGGCCWSLMICPCGICPVRVVWSISVLMDFFFLVRLSQTVCVGVIWSSLLERLNGCACGLGTEAMMICDTFPSTPSFSLSLCHMPAHLQTYTVDSISVHFWHSLPLSLCVSHPHTVLFYRCNPNNRLRCRRINSRISAGWRGNRLMMALASRSFSASPS